MHCYLSSLSVIFSEEDLNAKNSGGYTPLMYAAYIGHDNVVNMLIDAQVDVNLSNLKGHTPLMLAASCGNESVCDFLKDVSTGVPRVKLRYCFATRYLSTTTIIQYIMQYNTTS